MAQLTVKYMCHQVENSLLTDIMATDVEHCIRVCPLSSMMYMQIWLHLWKVIMSPHMLGALSLCNIAYRHDGNERSFNTEAAGLRIG